VETYTVMFGRDQAETALAACLTGDGHRVWARSTDPAVMDELQSRECVGNSVHVDADGALRLG
jgi:hypothetical protein